MSVADILKVKGSGVKTIRPDEPALTLAQRLKEEGIGAMIVCRDGRRVDGIISERDLAYGLAEHGPAIGRMTVEQLMTSKVMTCSPSDSVQDVSRLMTTKRIRHVPVMDGSHLAGIVTIGDVLKHRIAEVQLEANVLRDFAIARG